MELLKIVSFQTALLVCIFTMAGAQSTELMRTISSVAFDLYEQCAHLKRNNSIIISPSFVATSLGLLAQGTKYNSPEKAAVANQFAEYYNELQDDNSVITMVNQLYVPHRYHRYFKKEFPTDEVEQFFSRIEMLNFSNPYECALKLNRYVEQKTNRRIRYAFHPQMFDEQTRLVSINVIHLKGSQLTGFNKECTHRGRFYINRKTSVPADFLCFNEKFDHKVLNELDATAIAMRYMQTKYTFVIVLPNRRIGLANLEAKIKNYSGDLFEFKDRSKIGHSVHYVNVTIPKFRIDFEIELNGIFKNLGMGTVDIFNENTNFTGLLDSYANVRKIVHKAFIEFDEGGSDENNAGIESAAHLHSSSIPNESFRVDRPFMYFLVDNSNNVIFSGRVKRNPNALKIKSKFLSS